MKKEKEVNVRLTIVIVRIKSYCLRTGHVNMLLQNEIEPKIYKSEKYSLQCTKKCKHNHRLGLS